MVDIIFSPAYYLQHFFYKVVEEAAISGNLESDGKNEMELKMLIYLIIIQIININHNFLDHFLTKLKFENCYS